MEYNYFEKNKIKSFLARSLYKIQINIHRFCININRYSFDLPKRCSTIAYENRTFLLIHNLLKISALWLK